MTDKAIRLKIASDLEALARILVEQNLIQDASPLYSAASNCRDSSNEGMWEYRINNLIFRGSTRLKSKPAVVNNISISFSIYIEGFCQFQDERDPLTALQVNIVIYGDQRVEENDSQVLKSVKASWHLDRHVQDPDDKETPEFFHPCYHFHFGGRLLGDLPSDKENIYSVLLLDSPRIAHPPLDGFTGIDFVLTNFMSVSELGFREEGSFQNLMIEPQRLLWKAYTNMLAGNWEANAHLLPWTPSSIWPQLLTARR